jgi:hypothetical protein
MIIMSFIDWLFFEIIVSRRLTNAYYFIMLTITLIAVVLAYKMKYKRFSMYLWLVSGTICLFWEIYLFTTGGRNYNFPPALELLYHAITEAGPGLIIMILVGHKLKIIDISEFSDEPKIGQGTQRNPKSNDKGKRKVAKLDQKSCQPIKNKGNSADKNDVLELENDLNSEEEIEEE